MCCSGAKGSRLEEQGRRCIPCADEEFSNRDLQEGLSSLSYNTGELANELLSRFHFWK